MEEACPEVSPVCLDIDSLIQEVFNFLYEVLFSSKNISGRIDIKIKVFLIEIYQIFKNIREHLGKIFLGMVMEIHTTE